MSAADTYNLKNPTKPRCWKRPSQWRRLKQRYPPRGDRAWEAKAQPTNLVIALGVLAKNDPALVEQIMTWLGASGDEKRDHA